MQTVGSRTCSVSNYLLNSAPYNLAWGSIVYSKVVAINYKGNSLASNAGSGAVILRVPDPPVLL